MKSILDLFRKTPTPAAEPDILDYDDELEASKRLNTKLEQRIVSLREKLVDLEGLEERIQLSIVENTRECENKVRQAGYDAKDAARQAALDAKDKLRDLRDKITELESQQTIKTQEIEHMVRMNDEQNELKIERKTVELERSRDAEVQKVRDDYSGKLEEIQKQQIADGDKRFEQILKRLPDTDISLRGKVGG